MLCVSIVYKSMKPKKRKKGEKEDSEIKTGEKDEVQPISTAIVWDYVDSDTQVLILTNYHTWNERNEFAEVFPPLKTKKRAKTENDPLILRLSNAGFIYEFALKSEMFFKYAMHEDYAILKLPANGFTMERIPITLQVSLTLRIHAVGYVGHTQQLNITGGEVSSFIPEGFTMNLLSAPGYSGAAILSDYLGRAVGYMGGNWDSSKSEQRQSYAYRFDHVILATGRELTPRASPTKSSNTSSNK